VCRCRRAESTGSNSADWVEEGLELAGPGFARREVDGPVAGGWGSPTRSHLEPKKKKRRSTAAPRERAPPQGSRSVVVADGANPDVPESGWIGRILDAEGSLGGVGLLRGGHEEVGRSVPLLAVVEDAAVEDYRGLGRLGQLAARVEDRGRYSGDGVQVFVAELPRVDRETWGQEWSRIAGPKIHHRTSSRSPWRRAMRRSSPDRSNRTARHRASARDRGDARSSDGTAHWARGR